MSWLTDKLKSAAIGLFDEGGGADVDSFDPMSLWGEWKDLTGEHSREAILDAVSKSYGGGEFNGQMKSFFLDLDRYRATTLPPNSIHSGYTFITRPKLCLSDWSLPLRPEFAALNTNDVNSIQYAIRCMLDTKYHKTSTSVDSPLLNPKNPFMTPVCNGLIGMSGFPDPSIDTKTSDEGFHSEDQTVAIGYDMLNKTYDLSLSFRDPQNGPVAALMYYWMLYIGMVTKGLMPAYAEDIQQQRLNYTVSIYRFVMDPSKRYIQHYAKATGCFPKSVPIGEFFDYSESQNFISGAGNFSIPFVANKIEYNNPNILIDFRLLVERYHDKATDGKIIADKPNLPIDASNNRMGIPYVVSEANESEDGIGKLALVFR